MANLVFSNGGAFYCEFSVADLHINQCQIGVLIFRGIHIPLIHRAERCVNKYLCFLSKNNIIWVPHY